MAPMAPFDAHHFLQTMPRGHAEDAPFPATDVVEDVVGAKVEQAKHAPDVEVVQRLVVHVVAVDGFFRVDAAIVRQMVAGSHPGGAVAGVDVQQALVERGPQPVGGVDGLA